MFGDNEYVYQNEDWIQQQNQPKGDIIPVFGIQYAGDQATESHRHIPAHGIGRGGSPPPLRRDYPNRHDLETGHHKAITKAHKHRAHADKDLALRKADGGNPQSKNRALE